MGNSFRNHTTTFGLGSLSFSRILLFLFCISLFSSFVLANPIENTILEVSVAYQDPDPVEPGEFVELKFNVKNNGGNVAKSVEFRLVPEHPFTLYDESAAVQSVGDIRVYDSSKTDTEEISFKYRFAVAVEAIDGNYDLQLQYKAIGGSSVGIWQNLDPIQVKVQTTKTQLYVRDVITEPERSGPGEELLLTLALENLGASTLQDIKVVLDLDNTTYFAPYQSSNEKIVQSLLPRDVKPVSFGVISLSDTPLRPHKIPLKLTYKDPSGKSYEKKLFLPIIIDAMPEYILNLEDTDIYQKDSRGKIVISMSNIGSSDINYVTLELQESESYEIISSSTVYVGNLESDDYETAQFDLYVTEYEKELPLRFVLTYKDNFNKQYVDAVTLPLKLFTTKEAGIYGVSKGKSHLLLKLIIALFIVGSLVYYFKYYKQGKKISF